MASAHEKTYVEMGCEGIQEQDVVATPPMLHLVTEIQPTNANYDLDRMQIIEFACGGMEYS